MLQSPQKIVDVVLHAMTECKKFKLCISEVCESKAFQRYIDGTIRLLPLKKP